MKGRKYRKQFNYGSSAISINKSHGKLVFIDLGLGKEELPGKGKRKLMVEKGILYPDAPVTQFKFHLFQGN